LPVFPDTRDYTIVGSPIVVEEDRVELWLQVTAREHDFADDVPTRCPIEEIHLQLTGRCSLPGVDHLEGRRVVGVDARESGDFLRGRADR